MVRQLALIVLVFQDGRDFYDEETRELLYSAPIGVPDGNVFKAKIAREMFAAHAAVRDWSVTFVGG